MENKKYTIPEILEEVNALINQAEKVNCFTRSTRLQKIEINNLTKAISFIKNFKYQAIERNNENLAMDFFKMQCLLNSYKSILEGWLSIKESKFEPAWSFLIDSQEYCDMAIRIFNCQVTENLKNHLKAIEKSIFPSFAYYNSIGVLETPGKCSICSSPFNDCDHLENGIYMGRLCRRIERNIIEINHSALVETPHDRRCIFTHIEIDGVMVDNFTREPDEGPEPLSEETEVKEVSENTETKDGMSVKAILFNNKALDFD